MNLKELSIFKGGRDTFYETLEGSAHVTKYEKNALLFVSGDEAQNFYLIKSGWVKLFRETLDGSQSVVDILSSGHIFGEASIYEEDTYPYSAEVVETAEIVSFSLSLLKNEIKENNDFAFNMLSSMARYRKQQDREIEHRTIQNAPQRIGCFLLRLTSQQEQGPITIHLPYDKTLVASRLGMQPETFSRALTKLKDKTGIRIKGATVEMDTLDQLINYSCAACSSGFPCKDLKKA